MNETSGKYRDSRKQHARTIETGKYLMIDLLPDGMMTFWHIRSETT